MTLVHQLTSCEVKKLFVFIINKVIIKIDASDDLKLKHFIKIFDLLMELMDKHTSF